MNLNLQRKNLKLKRESLTLISKLLQQQLFKSFIMKRAYVSCPMTVSQQTLDKVIAVVSKHAYAIHWVKGSDYDEKAMKKIITDADAFILILPEVSWMCKYSSMTSGSRKEFLHAVDANVPVFIAYRSSEGMGIYATEIKKNGVNILSVSGIASTRHNFEQCMNLTTPNITTSSSSNAKTSLDSVDKSWEQQH